jgi:hypothetical protein
VNLPASLMPKIVEPEGSQQIPTWGDGEVLG